MDEDDVRKIQRTEEEEQSSAFSKSAVISNAYFTCPVTYVNIFQESIDVFKLV